MRAILDIPVSQLMSQPAVTVHPETPIEVLTEMMTTHPFNAFPVVDEGNVLRGMVSRIDLFRLYLMPYYRFIPSLEETWVKSVAAIMNRAVISLFPHEPALKAILYMVEHRIRTIPVVTDTVGGPVVVGVITRRDLGPALKS